MADLNERDAKLIQYLGGADGKERELETALGGPHRDDDQGPYKKRLKQHLRETKAHAKGVERRIKKLGGGGQLKQTAVGKAMAAAKGPLHMIRGSGEQEKMLKNAKTEYFNEHEEIATYLAIEVLAERVGDRDTAKLAKGIRREERMAKFLEGQIKSLTVLSRRLPRRCRPLSASSENPLAHDGGYRLGGGPHPRRAHRCRCARRLGGPVGSRWRAVSASLARRRFDWRRRGGERAGGVVASRPRRAPISTAWRRRDRTGLRRASARFTPTVSPRSTMWSRSARTSIAPLPRCARGSRPAPDPRGADPGGRAPPSLLPAWRADPRGRAGACRGDRADRWRSSRVLLGPRFRRSGPRGHRRHARRPRRRGPRGRSARSPDRHAATLRRPLAAGGADYAAAQRPAGGGRRSSTLKPQSRCSRAAISERWHASGSRSTQSSAAWRRRST